jgi:hypothetical protein
MKSMFWRNYSTKKALQETIQGRVNSQPFEVPFEDSLISDLISERHYFCSLAGLRPTSFKKTKENAPYRLYGHFDHGWHPVSWTKSLSRPRSETELIVRALRDRISPIKMAFRREHPICAHCATAQSEEVHHADPTFEAITDEVLAGLPEDAVNAALSTWDWFKAENFTLPDDLELVRKFDALHKVARLEALCTPCHNETKKRENRGVASEVDEVLRDLLG